MSYRDRQLPIGNEVFLDHVGYFVRDLAGAGDQLARLGFQVSAINVQTNADAAGNLSPSGTSNRLARLRRGYLEILAATHETPLAAQFRGAISRYAGLHLIAFAHDDILAQRARLTAAGFAMQPVVQLDRKDKTLPGAPRVAWHVLRPDPGVMPEGRVQFTKSLTPDVLWQDQLLVHTNTADTLTDMLLVVADVAEATDRFSRYAGCASRETTGLTVFDLARGRLIVAGSDDTRRLLPAFAPHSLPYMAGQAIRVGDLSTARATLQGADIKPLVDRGGLILLGPNDALGSYMLFHDASVDTPWEALAGFHQAQA